MSSTSLRQDRSPWQTLLLITSSTLARPLVRILQATFGSTCIATNGIPGRGRMPASNRYRAICGDSGPLPLCTSTGCPVSSS